MKRLLLLASLLPVTGNLMAQRVMALNAAKYMGEYMNVWGKVHGFELINDKKTILLYLGADFPKQDFTIIIEDNTKNPVARRQERTIGELIIVYGKIFLYKGKPAIKMKDWEDVGFLRATDSPLSENK
jgi:hypothetical protein